MVPPWWKTQFLTDIGLKTTSRLFPRTAVAAALNSVTLAARTDHDQRVGAGRRVHLFRLPVHLEMAITDVLQGGEFEKEGRELLGRGDTGLRDKLAALAESQDVKAPEGPVSLGAAKALDTGHGASSLAAAYAKAFLSGRRLYPYFEVQGERA